MRFEKVIQSSAAMKSGVPPGAPPAAIGSEAGVESIARFTLVEQGADTKLVFDHAGFPKGEGEHFATGWKANDWEPMTKVLAQ